MKKLIAIFTMAAMSFAGVQVFALSAPHSSEMVALETKVKISPDKLPEPVKSTISNNFSDWEIAAAYLFTESKQYEVEFKQEGQSQTVKFDKEGNILR